ncbi:MAG: hypothetical protein ACLTYN_03220 [Dysosmobacter welbionis]
METKEHTRRRRTLRCSLCGLEITEERTTGTATAAAYVGLPPVFARRAGSLPPGAGREAAP